jgi:hypothetical protein
MPASTFHSICNGLLGGTLTVIKTLNSFIFGGYTQADWNPISPGNKNDSSAFLFSLVNAYNVSVRLNVTNSSNAIYVNNSFLSSFGFQGNDLSITNAGLFLTGSSTKLGESYTLPFNLNQYDADSFLAGSTSFTPIELEVYA